MKLLEIITVTEAGEEEWSTPSNRRRRRSSGQLTPLTPGRLTPTNSAGGQLTPGRITPTGSSGRLTPNHSSGSGARVFYPLPQYKTMSFLQLVNYGCGLDAFNTRTTIWLSNYDYEHISLEEANQLKRWKIHILNVPPHIRQQEDNRQYQRHFDRDRHFERQQQFERQQRQRPQGTFFWLVFLVVKEQLSIFQKNSVHSN